MMFLSPDDATQFLAARLAAAPQDPRIPRFRTPVPYWGGGSGPLTVLERYPKPMAWKRLPDVSNSDLPNDFTRKTRFLVDESLGIEVSKYLRERGYNALFAGDVQLMGHSDEDVFGFAWRERRVLLTHDHDYLDDVRFPEHRNPGVIVLAGGSGDEQAMGMAIATAILVFGKAPGVWEKSKITISADGYLTIRSRDHETGHLVTRRYRRIKGGYEQFY